MTIKWQVHGCSPCNHHSLFLHTVIVNILSRIMSNHHANSLLLTYFRYVKFLVSRRKSFPVRFDLLMIFDGTMKEDEIMFYY